MEGIGIYFIFIAVVIIAIFAFIISYREDHPKKAK